MPTAVQLIAEHRNHDQLILPTGSLLFSRGTPVRSIYAIERGLVELSSGGRDRLRYGDGEVFFYEDLIAETQRHSRTATAITPPQFTDISLGSLLSPSMLLLLPLLMAISI